MSERLVQFGQNGALNGVLRSSPCGDDATGVLLFNAGVIHRIGPHRLNVKIARSIDAPSLRFDLSGQGESAPAGAGLGYEQQASADIADAIDIMQSECAVRDITIIGICSGADHAMRAAVLDDRIGALVLIDPFAYPNTAAASADFLARAADPDRWLRKLGSLSVRREEDGVGGAALSPDSFDQGRPVAPKEKFAADLATLSERGVRILIVYSGLVRRYVSKPAHFFQTFAGHGFEGRIEVVTMPSADHTFTPLTEQNALIDRIRCWFGHETMARAAS